MNVVHPNAVFDTGIWTEDVLARRAESYGVSVEDYRRMNVLKTEVTSVDVARMVVAMCGPAFAKTTGAQVPVDGGNDRVIYGEVPGERRLEFTDGTGAGSKHSLGTLAARDQTATPTRRLRRAR